VHKSTTARLALLALVWGSSFLWIKLSLRGLSPVEVTFGRLILGAAVLLLIAAAARSPLPRSPALWAHMSVAALFGNAAPYLLFALGEQRVSSSTAGILNATTPLWTLVVAMATRHERTVTPARLAGLVIGFGGALLIFSPWRSGSDLTSAGGLDCLGAAVSYGIAFVYMDRFIARRGISPVVLSAGQLLVASGFLAAGLGVEGAPSPRLGTVVAVSIAILGLFGTGPTCSRSWPSSWGYRCSASAYRRRCWPGSRSSCPEWPLSGKEPPGPAPRGGQEASSVPTCRGDGA
jgi:drug/metabolite transporter (DMT)-like permease